MLFRDEGQAIDLLEQHVDTGSAFVLARNREFLRPYARALFERRVPYLVEGKGGISPLSDPRLVRAVRAGIELAAGAYGRPRAGAIADVLEYAPPELLGSHGTKARVGELAQAGARVGPAELQELGLDTWVRELQQRGVVESLSGVPRATRAYLGALLARYGEIPEPRLRLTSIHGSKGREADLVVLVPDMSASAHREFTQCGQAGFEAENRVFYVGVTRAKRTLVVVAPQRRRHYDFPRVEAQP